MAGQDGFDLAGFDAVAVDLELVVAAAEHHQLPAGTEEGEVAGPVGAGAGVRVGGEAGVGLGGPVQVAGRDTGPGDDEFPGGAGQGEPAVRRAQLDRRVVDRCADGHRAGRRVLAQAQGVGAAADGGLGGSVLVGDEQAGYVQEVKGGGGQLLAADDQVPGGCGDLGAGQIGGEQAQAAGGDLQRAQVAGPGEGCGEVRGLVGGQQGDGLACQQRQEQAGDGHVDADRGMGQGAAAVRGAVVA